MIVSCDIIAADAPRRAGGSLPAAGRVRLESEVLEDDLLLHPRSFCASSVAAHVAHVRRGTRGTARTPTCGFCARARDPTAGPRWSVLERGSHRDGGGPAGRRRGDSDSVLMASVHVKLIWLVIQCPAANSLSWPLSRLPGSFTA